MCNDVLAGIWNVDALMYCPFLNYRSSSPLISGPTQIRAYNALARLARGDFLVMIQDDNLPPTTDNCSWISEVIRLFERWG